MSRPFQDPEEFNELSGLIIACAMEVHRNLGPGLLERLYEEAMCLELAHRDIAFERQRRIGVEYKGTPIGDHLLDLVVEGLVVVELKAVDSVAPAHLAQLVSYLKLGEYPLGLLLNFNVSRMKDGIFRRANTPSPSREDSV